MSADARETREENQSLWLLIAAPTVWAAHFLASYATAAVWCARYAPRDASLAPARTAIAIYTTIALLMISACAAVAWRRHAWRDPRDAEHADTAAARHRFMGSAALLLAALSAIATAFAAMAAYLIRSCA